MNKLEMINVTKSYKHKNANENINLVKWSIWTFRTKWCRKIYFNEANSNSN